MTKSTLEIVTGLLNGLQGRKIGDCEMALRALEFELNVDLTDEGECGQIWVNDEIEIDLAWDPTDGRVSDVEVKMSGSFL